VTPLEVTSGQPGEDVSVAASGTDRAWQIGMNFVEAVVGASSGGDARFAIDGLAGDDGRSCVDCGGVCWWWRGACGGDGPFVAMDNAVEGVRWSSPDGGGADDGPVKRPWLAERQRPFAATMEIVGLKVGGRW
jgi:hypothetical protein